MNAHVNAPSPLALSARPADAPAIMAIARRVLEIEATAITDVAARLDAQFVDAVTLCLACKGRVAVSGMGKSGHIAHKIAATLASTGTPAFFLHPAEAAHGDLGMLQAGDILLAISHSGESAELITLIPFMRRQGIRIMVMTGNASATLAQEADIILNTAVDKEACSLGLAPTASTTAALALGDALAVTLLDLRGFAAEDFALTHPSGRLGRRLLIKVADLMHQGDALPQVKVDTRLLDALRIMTQKGLGMTAVIDDEQRIVGILTDGDLRRALAGLVENAAAVATLCVEQAMTQAPITIDVAALAATAVDLMEAKRITVVLVTDAQNRLVGALHMHDLLRAGVV